MWKKASRYVSRQQDQQYDSELPVGSRDRSRSIVGDGMAPCNDPDLAEEVPADRPFSLGNPKTTAQGSYSWEQWYKLYKTEAGLVNPSLAVSEEGGSLVDFLDKNPLVEAHKNNICPRTYGRFFGRHFDV